MVAFDALPGAGFGRVGAADQQRSDASQEAARRLLARAYEALLDGDDERVAHGIARALALPFDDFEGSHPAAMAVVLVVSDVLEDALHANDEADAGEAWLDVALDMLDGLRGDDRLEWTKALLLTASTEDLHERERSRIQRRANAYTRAQLFAELPSDDTLGARVERMLHMAADYAGRFSAAFDAL